MTVVNLQHADGKTALERGDVDAWAGLDPLMATSEQEAGSTLIYRNVAFNSYGVLNVKSEESARNALDTLFEPAYAEGRSSRWAGSSWWRPS
ncbi:hypothetical protein [Actinoplanes sp. NPDC051851]|uniref:hypothetical protein n=1 Tax=Actinoplanes sp. NPDC051851 TaxID=3154753 RepID=UPI0034454CFE